MCGGRVLCNEVQEDLLRVPSKERVEIHICVKLGKRKLALLLGAVATRLVVRRAPAEDHIDRWHGQGVDP